MYLEHYGVKGMKWGVRRYQNKDGSLTTEGRRRQYYDRQLKYVTKTHDDVESIYNTMSQKERFFLTDDAKTKMYLKIEDGASVAKRFIKKVGDTPVAFLDIFYDRAGGGAIAIGTRSGDEYRGKGYAKELSLKAIGWVNTSPKAKEILDMPVLNWGAWKDNEKSIGLAKKLGFEGDIRKDNPNVWLGKYHAKR